MTDCAFNAMIDLDDVMSVEHGEPEGFSVGDIIRKEGFDCDAQQAATDDRP